MSDIILKHEARPKGVEAIDGLTLAVDHGCFVPSLGKVSTHLAAYAKPIAASGARLLDLGTGSGYFAIYLAKVAGTNAIGVDISESLCVQARANAQRNGVGTLVEFRTCATDDLFSPVDEDEKFDLIVANLPFTRWIRAARSWHAYWSDFYPCFRGTTRLMEQLVLGSQHHARRGSRLVFCFGDSGDREFLASLIDLSAWQVRAIEQHPGGNDTFYIYDLELRPEIEADYETLNARVD